MRKTVPSINLFVGMSRIRINCNVVSYNLIEGTIRVLMIVWFEKKKSLKSFSISIFINLSLFSIFSRQEISFTWWNNFFKLSPLLKQRYANICTSVQHRLPIWELEGGTWSQTHRMKLSKSTSDSKFIEIRLMRQTDGHWTLENQSLDCTRANKLDTVC